MKTKNSRYQVEGMLARSPKREQRQGGVVMEKKKQHRTCADCGAKIPFNANACVSDKCWSHTVRRAIYGRSS